MAKKNNKQTKYHSSQGRCICASGKEVPWLNLSAARLSEAGFNISYTIHMVGLSGLLLIERIGLSEEEQ